MSQPSYTVERAAYLLGMPKDKIRDLIDQHLVDTIEESGETRVPKSEIARLYHHLAAGEPLEVREKEAEVVKQPSDSERPGVIRVTDERLKEIHSELKSYQERIENLTHKIKRLGMRMQRLQAMATGEQAKFWERASAVHPEIWADKSFSVIEEDGEIVIQPLQSEAEDGFKDRFREMVLKGIRHGHLPQGFMGIFLKDESES